MNWDLIAVELFNGLILGSLYILLSLGLSIIFGMLGIINFAHGALYMMGAYAAYSAATFLGLSFWAALLVVPAALFLFGAAVERTLVRPLYRVPGIYIMLLTFGLMMALQDAARAAFGDIGVPFDIPEALAGAVNLGFFYYPKYRLFLIAVTAACTLGVWLFLVRTKAGAIIRAGTDNAAMVEALGIDVGRAFTLVFALGAALAGLAGVLAAPIQGVKSEMGTDFLVDCFVVVVVGGMGSIGGSVLGGLIVGELIILGVLIWPPMAHTLIYLFMALFLLIRPRGIFGRAAFHD